MKKLFLLSVLMVFTTFMWATPPTITIDGDKSDWAEVPMLSEPGTWPMLKVLPAADAELGTNALVYMMENTTDFDPTWAQYPTEFIDKDYDKTTEAISEYWAFPAMGVDYKATTGVNAGGWISFPKGMSDDNKVFEIGFPATYITDLGSKFGFAMYYNSGAWFCPDYSSPAVNPSNGFLYKNRSFSTMPCTLTMTNVFAHQSIGECVDYVDFGLRDNGNDTARWAAWPVELTKPGKYDVITNVTSTLGWKFEFWLVDVATNAVVAHMDAPTSNVSSSKTTYNFGTMDLSSVPAGKYMLKVKNRTQYSTVKLESVVLDYLGGAIIDIPETLEPVDAMRSEYAFVNGDGEFRFTDDGHDGYVTSQWGKWNIHVSKGGLYNFTLNANSDNSHKYYLSILNPDESEIIKYTLNGSSGTALSKTTDNLELAAGDYIVKIENYVNNSHGRVISIVANYAGGATTNIPGTLNPIDALRSEYALINGDGEFRFTDDGHDGYVTSQWGKWNVHVSKGGLYNFTLNANSDNSHHYYLSILNPDESEIVKYTLDGSSNTPLTATTADLELAEGNYIVKIENFTNHSHGRVISIVANYAGGAVTNIPGQILGEDALLYKTGSKYMIRTEDGYLKSSNNGDPTSEWAVWNIAATAGTMNVTLNLDPVTSSGHNYRVELYDGDVLKDYAEELASAELGDAVHTKGDILLGKTLVVPADGNYTIKLINRTQWSSMILQGITFAAVPVLATITMNDADGDNSAWGANVDGAAVNVELTRSFTGGMYNTICLPFAVESEGVEAAFGAGVELMYMSGATLDGTVLDLQFASTTSIYQGTPYLIKPVANVVNPTFSNVMFKVSDASGSVTSYTDADFIGTFIKKTIPANTNNLYLQANNLLEYSQDAVTIKGTRAYFHVNVSEMAPIVRPRIVLNGQVLTDIELVDGEPQTNGKFIENGQLIILRDGVRYNALGIRVK